MNQALMPDKILQTGFAFWSSKTLLSAVELELFTLLAEGPLDAESIRERLGLHPRSHRDFLDALVALGFLSRDNGLYGNTPETDLFLDRGKPSYLGGILEMANARLYPFWSNLTEALRTGRPQNEIKNGENLFDELYEDPARLEQFLRAMSGISAAPAQAIAEKFPWGDYRSFVDVGAAEGALVVHVAKRHEHLTGGGFDLPVTGPIFDNYVGASGLNGRVQFYPGDFFKDPLPRADVLTMGHILHDWDLDQKKLLIRKAYEALPEGGALLIYEALIDDAREKNAFGLLMSLNMLIETSGGFDYSGADCIQWLTEAGFRQTRVEHLHGPDSMVVAIK
jgi:hypothetical protein